MPGATDITIFLNPFLNSAPHQFLSILTPKCVHLPPTLLPLTYSKPPSSLSWDGATASFLVSLPPASPPAINRTILLQTQILPHHSSAYKSFSQHLGESPQSLTGLTMSEPSAPCLWPNLIRPLTCLLLECQIPSLLWPLVCVIPSA